MSDHQPVLLKETIDLLAIKPDGIYVDLTFGRGGQWPDVRQVCRHCQHPFHR